MKTLNQKRLAKVIALGLVVGGFSFANVDNVYAAKISGGVEVEAGFGSWEKVGTYNDLVAVNKEAEQAKATADQAKEDAALAAGKAQIAKDAAADAQKVATDAYNQSTTNKSDIADLKQNKADKSDLDGKLDKTDFEAYKGQQAGTDSDQNKKIEANEEALKQKVDKTTQDATNAKLEAGVESNSKYIADVDAKVDANKAEQAATDKTQNDRLDLNDRVDKYQSQAIGGLQSDNLDQDREIAANKENIDKVAQENKTQNDRLDLNDRVDKYQSQAIGGLQSDNLDQDREIAANKENIDKVAQENKTQNDRLDLNDRVDKYQSQAIGGLQSDNLDQDREIAANKENIDKLAQENKTQNDRLDLNDRVDKYQSQAIAGLQSDNLAQDREIAANKENITANKENIDKLAQENKAQNDRLDLNDRVDKYQSQAIGKLQTENVEQNRYTGNEADKKKYDGKLNYTDIDASLSENVADLDHSLKTEESARIENDEQLRQNIQNVDTKFSGEVSRLDSRIDKVDDKINKVGAMAAAIANLHTMGYDPEAPTEFAMSVGQYRDETGMAIGLFHYPNRDFMLSLSVSRAGEEYMGGIGATWKFGRKSPEKMLAEQKEKAAKEKLAKAEAMKEAARQARVEAQMARHAKMLAEREAAK